MLGFPGRLQAEVRAYEIFVYFNDFEDVAKCSSRLTSRATLSTLLACPRTGLTLILK
jgi:hypothetical protein